MSINKLYIAVGLIIAFGLFFPNNGFARLSGFSGVFLWLFFGFATAVVRIT